MHTYPSVTICHAFKDNKDVVMDILNERNESNIPQKVKEYLRSFYIHITEIMAEYVAQGNNVSVLFREFEKYAWTLPQILQVFLSSTEYCFRPEFLLQWRTVFVPRSSPRPRPAAPRPGFRSCSTIPTGR